MTHRVNTLQWMCEQKGIAWHTFCSRYYMYGWSLDRAMNEPIGEHKENFRRIQKEIYRDYKENGMKRNELAKKYKYTKGSISVIIKKQKRKEQEHGAT